MAPEEPTLLYKPWARPNLTSHNVDGIVKRQRKRSENASVTIKTFLAVRIVSRPSTAHKMRTLPKNPTMMKTV